MFRIRFKLIHLLLLATCVAAFLGGWEARKRQATAIHKQQRADLEQRIKELREEYLADQLQRRTDQLMQEQRLDEIEHKERMKMYHSSPLQQLDSMMAPAERF